MSRILVGQIIRRGTAGQFCWFQVRNSWGGKLILLVQTLLRFQGASSIVFSWCKGRGGKSGRGEKRIRNRTRGRLDRYSSWHITMLQYPACLHFDFLPFFIQLAEDIFMGMKNKPPGRLPTAGFLNFLLTWRSLFTFVSLEIML